MSSGQPRPVALTGFMGAGKTTLGTLLAEALKRPFFDTDAEVERRSGRSVPSFFPAEEPEFRRLEAEVVAELLSRGPSVVALGGGALLNATTRALVSERAVLVHLQVPWADLEPEIPALAARRPLLQGRTPAEIERLYREREAVYDAAPVRVAIARGDVDVTLARLLDALRSSASDPSA